MEEEPFDEKGDQGRRRDAATALQRVARGRAARRRCAALAADVYQLRLNGEYWNPRTQRALAAKPALLRQLEPAQRPTRRQQRQERVRHALQHQTSIIEDAALRQRALAAKREQSRQEEEAAAAAALYEKERLWRENPAFARLRPKPTELQLALEAREEDNWVPCVNRALKDTDLNLAWTDVGGAVSPVLLSPQLRHLTAIRLVGNALEALPDEFGTCFPLLTDLTLNQNRLRALPDSICALSHLVRLSAIKNRLRLLPSKIGRLGGRLRSLELHDNRLRRLPKTFSRLELLAEVDLDQNRLRTLPGNLGNLKCHTLVLDHNCLTAVPRTLAALTTLTYLGLNSNRLRALPGELAALPRLAFLQACDNRLMQLPATLPTAPALTRVWVAYNNLTDLPYTFADLGHITELKLDGNRHMLYPPIAVCSQGAAAVRSWCAGRVERAHRRALRQRVDTLLDALEIVAAEGLADPAVFESPVIRKRGKRKDHYHAFQLDAFLEEAVPALEAWWATHANTYNGLDRFDLTEEQLREAFAHEVAVDALGRLQRDVPGEVVRFRACRCVDRHGRRLPCERQNSALMLDIRKHGSPFRCERPAFMVRTRYVEREALLLQKKAEREAREMAREMVRVENAANAFCFTEDGREHLDQQAMALTKEQLYTRRDRVREARAARVFANARANAITKYAKDQKALIVRKARAEEQLKLTRRSHKIELGLPSVPVARRAHLRAEVVRIGKLLNNLPEFEELVQLEQAHQDELRRMQVRERKLDEAMLKARPEFQERLLINRAAIPEQFVAAKKEEARAKLLKRQRLMAEMMHGLAGVGVRDVFHAWAAYAKHVAANRDRLVKDRQARRVQRFKDMHAQQDLAVHYASRYVRKTDPYTDKVFWQHVKTGEIRWAQPTADEFLAPDFKLPSALEDVVSSSESDSSDGGGGGRRRDDWSDSDDDDDDDDDAGGDSSDSAADEAAAEGDALGVVRNFRKSDVRLPRRRSSISQALRRVSARFSSSAGPGAEEVAAAAVAALDDSSDDLPPIEVPAGSAGGSLRGSGRGFLRRITMRR